MDIARPRSLKAARRRKAGLAAAGGVALLAAGALGLGRLRPAAPSVDKGAVWMDTVRRGPLVREVLGSGTLVPEEVRWVAAPAAGRVERVLARPGATVAADTVLVTLANPDLQRLALEAEGQLAQARAELAGLDAKLAAEGLAQESTIATLAADLADARRRARADEDLARRGFLSSLEQEQTLGRATELQGRVAFERRRLTTLTRSRAAQRAAQRAQLDQLRALAAFRRGEVDALTLRAGVPGVLQELSLQPGQAVAAGAPVARVARPDRLQAEVRIPETQTPDVRVGQRASVDTRNGIIPGRVARIDPAAQGGTVRVEVALTGPLPAGARPDLNVEAVIELERLGDVLQVGRPAGAGEGTVGLFRVESDGGGAVRTPVTLGRHSVKSVEIRGGLAEGDRVILSDMSPWDGVDRVRLP